MELTIWYKFSQHRELREELLATGDAELIEVRGSRLSVFPAFASSH